MMRDEGRVDGFIRRLSEGAAFEELRHDLSSRWIGSMGACALQDKRYYITEILGT